MTPKRDMPRHDKVELVVIGASAGGVEALGLLLQSLPADFRPAIVIVIHLPADRSSALPQLFAKRCRRPVKEAEDKEMITAGTVYIAPADYHLLVEPDRSLSLSRDAALHYSRPSIDMLFESAAFAYREHLLGIILTGASKDGALGLKQIRQCGGAAWAQDPEEASSRTMPQAAIEIAGTDQILKLSDISAHLSRIVGPSNEAEQNDQRH